MRRSVTQLAVTLLALFGSFVAMHFALRVGYWLTLAFSVVAAGFLVRTFIIMHDCGHGSFFRSRRANDLVGFVTGALTLTPYAQWAKDHAIHHATSGRLDKRGYGDIETLTVEEYRALGRLRRIKYAHLPQPGRPARARSDLAGRQAARPHEGVREDGARSSGCTSPTRPSSRL